MALLEVDDLVVEYRTEGGPVRAVDGVSYRIERGDVFGLVGESGAGKSAASLALLRLLDRNGKIVDGEIRFDGRDVLALSPAELREYRGTRVGMVFQDTESALNSTFTVGEQIAERIRAHEDADREEARARTIDLLEAVGVPDPDARYAAYPHELSGGLNQRVLIAMALSCEPDLLICDEPTTGLDVTLQAQLLELLSEVADEFETAIQLVTHDLGVVAALCDRVAVLYAGRIVERGTAEDVFYDPSHPYTAGLLASIPRIGDGRRRLPTIPGRAPDPIDPPTGCRFHPRCPYAEPICARRDPELVDVDVGSDATNRSSLEHTDGHLAACLEHTGDLEDGLGYDVVIRDEPGRQGRDERQEGRDGARGGEQRE
ncbi:ABC transporter ATP-binding protein [Natrialbaceae archaeon GCM10025810]|uniref:ABC transporter ATP-binding protein n=1 Tax=Halovalidus salilacus TaxID=3075124 RepID=UPI003605BB4B